METLYLQPSGLLSGKAFKEAASMGLALPLAGQDTGFSLLEIIRRDRVGERRSLYPVSSMAGSADQDIQQKLGVLTGARPSMAGLSFARPLVMGVINVTPDSFSDGGQFSGDRQAIEYGKLLVSQGADILDIGGESTRPGAVDVDEETEKQRVLPVIRGVSGLGCLCSIDSRHPAVMAAAVGAGADMVNDVTALGYDSRSIPVARKLSVPVVLMHSRIAPKDESLDMSDNPSSRNVVLDIYDYLEERVSLCVAAGIDRSSIIVDPGIGFGKTMDDNIDLLRNIALFHGLGVPLLVGVSRKRFVGVCGGEEKPSRRDPGSIALSLEMVRQGVQVVRVHNVADMKQALRCFLEVNRQT